MDAGTKNRVPWKSWSDFTGWAQDFSLRQKVLGGFLGVVVLVGLVTALIGTRLARETIINTARERLNSDLATATFVLKNVEHILDLKIRLLVNTEGLSHAVERGDVEEVRKLLTMVALENDFGFLSVTDVRGRVLVRSFNPQAGPGEDLGKDDLIVKALEGASTSGVTLVPVERLKRENPLLVKLIGETEKEGMIVGSAYPLKVDGKVVGALYGGELLNNNNVIVDRVSNLLFKGNKYAGKDLGFVTIYQGDRVVSTTLRGKDGYPLVGAKVKEHVRAQMLGDDRSEMMWETQSGVQYLSASTPIRGADGHVLGAIQVATQEEPINWVIDRLLATFLLVGLLGVILMGAITYFLVTWINRPLDQMLHAARRAAEGDLSHEVPVIARDEVGELAATFNLMIRNLAISRDKLEQWGKELASKVDAQTGELAQAREQVERIKKLASLEKMADGMAHIMAHISDPLVGFSASEDGSATSRILVLDPDEKVLETCRRVLEDEGLEVKLTDSARGALAELEKEFYDVVVTAVDVPEMTGRELLKEIKYRQPEVLVIFTTPFKDTEEAAECVKLGAYDYIPKPFGPHQISLMVLTALQTRQLLDKSRQEHAQQRAETIFQRVPVAIALADKAHRVVYHNNAFIDLASGDGQEGVRGKTFKELFGVDPLESGEESGGSRWLELQKVGRTAKLYNFKLPEEDLRVLMLLDVTDTVKKDQRADVLRTETLTRAQQVIHQQMRVAQEIAGLLGETTAETKAALFELIKLAGQEGEAR
ncbi:MAG: response regulator [Desulfomonilaceae bacterium]|nr:response regulator [Desulfomonilaceae bacterium]